ncbi:MAG: ABC transporter ATP-binding protein [Pirellulaceae bacterium]|jgi:ABC-type lipoprotein export system ATPase subunit
MPKSSPNTKPATSVPAKMPLITLQNVGKTYLDGNVAALRDVSLKIEEREFLSIMGPSGCGKSTLLHLLGGLDRPTQGRVLYRDRMLGDGIELDRFRAESIGFVFQSFYLLPNLTSIENVQIPMFEGKLSLADRVTRARELLDIVGLSERIHHLPHQLSIGQRQRVAVARALANNPCLVLADEPTGSLDSRSGSDLLDLLTQLNETQGTTLVIVTHDPLIAQRGRRLIRLLDGRVLEDSAQ